MLKKTGFFVLLLFSSCSASKLVIDNTMILQSHPKPIKIFSIGYWNKDNMILTLTDAQNNYFTIKAMRNDNLKVGNIYQK